METPQYKIRIDAELIAKLKEAGTNSVRATLAEAYQAGTPKQPEKGGLPVYSIVVDEPLYKVLQRMGEEEVRCSLDAARVCFIAEEEEARRKGITYEQHIYEETTPVAQKVNAVAQQRTTPVAQIGYKQPAVAQSTPKQKPVAQPIGITVAQKRADYAKKLLVDLERKAKG